VELRDILALSRLVPSIPNILVSIIERMLDTEDPKSDFEQSFANSAYVLGSCMQTLAKESPNDWTHKVDILSWTRSCIEKWAWSKVVLDGLVELIRAR
jgi:U3 small nucleolar RNA-associated protein 20